jgi:hypothetical protein
MTYHKDKFDLRFKKVAQKYHGHCIYKIREVVSPLHKEFRGFRLVVAVPNMNGHKPFSNESAPSFARSYMLFQSSDYSGQEMELKLKMHVQFLINRGFTLVEESEVYAERQRLNMAKSKGTAHYEREEV